MRNDIPWSEKREKIKYSILKHNERRKKILTTRMHIYTYTQTYIDTYNLIKRKKRQKLMGII